MLVTMLLMDNIAVACSVFQDVEGAQRLIESCYKEVNYVFMIDGAYKDYPYGVFPFSTDGLDYMVEQYHNVVLQTVVKEPEWKKRSAYLDLCKEYDIKYLLIVDSDEYFHPDSDWQQFKKDLLRCKDYIYNIKNYTPVLGGLIVPADSPRLWVNPKELEYKNMRHYQFGRIEHDSAIVAKETLYSIKLMHDGHLRSDERKEGHDAYIKKLEEYEKFLQLIECNKDKAQREYVVWNS